MKTQNVKSTTDPRLQIANCNRQLLAWQGWQLLIPNDWNPVKVEGDFDDGSLLIADMHAARLGLRWRKAAKTADPAKWADRAMRAEVGKLAASEVSDLAMPQASAWRISRLYTEPEPPGRDVWMGWSEPSGRVMEIVYHAQARDNVLAGDVLTTLADTTRGEPLAWSIFDLSVKTPAKLSLQWFKLNAGDLSLAFSEKRGRKLSVVRQIGPASLALARQPLDGWMSQQRHPLRKLYRPMSKPEPTVLGVGGQKLEGLRATLSRKRRLWWLWVVAKRLVLLGLHDPARKRLLIGQSEDEQVLRDLMASIGWAKGTE